jgi:hypothetical protein
MRRAKEKIVSDSTGAYPLDERNDLARQCADLRDQLATLRDEYAAVQERAAAVIAAFELDAGKTVDEVSERAYDDKDLVLDKVKDRCWENGYVEGLKAARNALDDLVARGIES